MGVTYSKLRSVSECQDAALLLSHGVRLEHMGTAPAMVMQL